ncbi:MAG: hypothetical protein M1834_002288 [Cirrosporium novae-zelandiae]|nr:MAG: hypothetical protein M1834_002288 [Cirrosporium novae-zelandiae]
MNPLPNPRRPSAAWSRLKGPPSDPLENIGLPLLDFKTQETYYTKIVERYMKFCASHGSNERPHGLDKAFASLSLVPEPSALATTIVDLKASTSSIPTLENITSAELSTIMMAMRKLREAIVASGRTDVFAQRAYVFIIRATILTKHMESYHPAILHLLHVIHPVTPLPSPEAHEFVGYYILDLACRLHELGDAYRVRHIYNLQDRLVDAVLDALVHDNWFTFWRLRRAVDGYQKRLLEWTEDDMRIHALKCLGRSYMGASKAYIERCTDREWEVLQKNNRVGWELDGEKVIIRRPKNK